MSIWKKIENWFICEENFFEKNDYWWGAFAVENYINPNNKALYRTMLRAAKNKARKTRIMMRNRKYDY